MPPPACSRSGRSGVRPGRRYGRCSERVRKSGIVVGALWRGFASMGAVERDGEFVVTRVDGAWIWGADGRRYLDATAGLWFTNVGHGRAEIADAVAQQIGRIAAYSTFGDYAVDTTVALADRLAAIAPVPGSKVFFTSGGSDSVDTAVKLSRRYWRECGQAGKTIVIGREKAYHGMHVAGTALAGIPVNHEGYGELMPDVRTVAWNSGKALLSAIETHGADSIAAFFCEPVIGAGGIYPPPDGYLDEVRRICREHDILFVADEVITGFGRIGGAWFASTRFDLQPDIMTTAKGLTSGYVPMGAVLVAPRVAEPFFDPNGGVWWRHGYTYGGRCGVPAGGVTVPPPDSAIRVEERFGHSWRHEDRAHRDVTRRETLCGGHDVGLQVESGRGEPGAADPTEAGDDLVSDEQYVVLPADPSYLVQVAIRRRVDAAGGDHRLTEEGGNGVGAVRLDGRQQRLARVPCNGADVRHQFAVTLVVDGNTGQRCTGDVHAVVSLFPPDNNRLAGLSAFPPVPAGQFHSGVDGIGTAGGEEHLAARHRRNGGQSVGQRHRGVDGVVAERGVRRNPADLQRDRVGDLGAPVPDVGEPEPGRRVEIAPAVGAPDPGTVTAGDDELPVPLDRTHACEPMPQCTHDDPTLPHSLGASTVPSARPDTGPTGTGARWKRHHPPSWGGRARPGENAGAGDR